MPYDFPNESVFYNAFSPHQLPSLPPSSEYLQEGSGTAPPPFADDFVALRRHQYGRGRLGNFFHFLARKILPLAKSAGKAIGQEALQTAAEIGKDVVLGEERESGGKEKKKKSLNEIVGEQTKAGVERLIQRGAKKVSSQLEQQNQKGRGGGRKKKKGGCVRKGRRTKKQQQRRGRKRIRRRSYHLQKGKGGRRGEKRKVLRQKRKVHRQQRRKGWRRRHGGRKLVGKHFTRNANQFKMIRSAVVKKIGGGKNPLSDRLGLN